MIWFTSDQHFNHENIIELCSRPFNKLGHMHKTIIRNYNEIVTKDDIVYFIGDVFWGKRKDELKKILDKLNGDKYLVLGNHDNLNPFSYEEVGFKQVATCLKVEEFSLVHDPAKSIINRNIPFICGHVHDLFKVQKNVINVSVDAWEFKPINIIEIRNLLGKEKELKKKADLEFWHKMHD